MCGNGDRRSRAFFWGKKRFCWKKGGEERESWRVQVGMSFFVARLLCRLPCLCALPLQRRPPSVFTFFFSGGDVVVMVMCL